MARTPTRRPALVTGLGLRVPGASSSKELASNLAQGFTGARIEKIRGLPHRAEVAIAREMSVETGAYQDRSVSLGLAAVTDALAGTRFETTEPSRRAIVVATAFGALSATIETVQRFDSNGPSAIGPRTVPSLMGNQLAAAIAMRHGCQGPCQTVMTACASGTDAIGQGMRLIEGNYADVVIVCGADAPLRPEILTGFQRLAALSTEVDDPEVACRPFDAKRTGLLMGEGAACVVLERDFGQASLGSVLGYASTTDAHHIVAPHPDGQCAEMAMRLAISSSALDIGDIGHVNAHGTGTVLNDLAESIAINRLFGPEVPVWSVKGCVGHLMGAAGTIEAIASLVALERGEIPRTIGLAEPDSRLAKINVVFGKPLRHPHRYAISNSSAFGGHNASVVVGAR